eukprot:scaffold6858_cov112-Isochrysis_galbana.AAC.5
MAMPEAAPSAAEATDTLRCSLRASASRAASSLGRHSKTWWGEREGWRSLSAVLTHPPTPGHIPPTSVSPPRTPQCRPPSCIRTPLLPVEVQHPPPLCMYPPPSCIPAHLVSRERDGAEGGHGGCERKRHAGPCADSEHHRCHHGRLGSDVAPSGPGEERADRRQGMECAVPGGGQLVAPSAGPPPGHRRGGGGCAGRAVLRRRPGWGRQCRTAVLALPGAEQKRGRDHLGGDGAPCGAGRAEVERPD